MDEQTFDEDTVPCIQHGKPCIQRFEMRRPRAGRKLIPVIGKTALRMASDAVDSVKKMVYKKAHIHI